MRLIERVPAGPVLPVRGLRKSAAALRPCEQVQEVDEWGFTCQSRTAGPW